ncbi:CLUMA_CG007679, isoform A, partial [Clunio marinus]
METNKISFGFSKVVKKPNLLKTNNENISKSNKVELIESIEGSSIKLHGKSSYADQEKKLVIPMTNDQKTTPLSKLIAAKTQKLSNLVKSEETNGIQIKQEPIDETLEQQAARELIEDLQKKVVKTEVKVFEVPMNADELPLEGAIQSSLDDYDRVPIGDFGKAMLRGMGWKDDEKAEDKKLLEAPVLRPKGMGLGADKVVKKQPLLVQPNQSETLEIKKNACVKILAGKHKNFYGTIEGFDDGGGRVIVKLAIGGLKFTINEFMLQPVAKQEFAKYGKILNSKKYEEFKSGETTSKVSENSSLKTSTTSENHHQTEEPSRNHSRVDHKSRQKNKSKDRRERDVSENSSNIQKYRGRSRSREKRSKKRRSRSSSSDNYRSHKKKSKQQRRRYSSSSDSRKYSSDYERR